VTRDLAAQLAAGPGWPAYAGAPVGGPLAGVRVLDLSRVLAGPFAAMVLADLGADVVKVERPGLGDDTRRWGPPFHGGDAAYFLAVNRGRRSLTLDLADPAGQAVAAHLATHADVVLENFLPDHLERLGLAKVRERCPSAVWVSIRGAGGDGPAGRLPGYDVMVQARSGLMSITGPAGGAPTKVGVAIADVVAGLYAAVSAVAGLVGRAARDGAAAPRIEVPLLECAVSALVNQAANYLVGGIVPRPLGNDHPNIAPYGAHRCADRPLVVGAGNDAQFAALCRAVGVPELADDPRFASNADRLAHRSELAAALEARLVTRSAAAWQEVLARAGVPCAVVADIADVMADEHIVAVELVRTLDHPAGPLPQVRSPLRVDGARLPVPAPPPTLGEHTDAVLTALGVDAGTLAALHERGVC